ncbi:MAG: hypothetical protein ACFCUQ_22710 [Kiloniellales bacterium]
MPPILGSTPTSAFTQPCVRVVWGLLVAGSPARLLRDPGRESRQHGDPTKWVWIVTVLYAGRRSILASLS